MEIAERFINYTKFDTQSAEDSETVPSTLKQLTFAKYLKEELEREGLKDVEMDEMGYIYATLPANTKKKIPTIGFISQTTYNSTQIWFRRQKCSPNYSLTKAKILS